MPCCGIRVSLAVTLLALIASCAHAQERPPAGNKTSVISNLTVTGARKIPADQIIAASGLKRSDAVTSEQIQAAAEKLAALGLFTSVTYRFSSKGTAMGLEFQVQEARTVPLSFDNFPWFADAEIASAIRQRVGLFTGEAPESGTLLDEITLAIEALLSSRQIKGAVEHRLVARPDGDGMILQYRVDGPVLSLQSLRFGDSLAADSERLKDRVSDIQGHPYSRFALEMFLNEQVRPLYASTGHLRAQIGPPGPSVPPAAGSNGNAGVDVLIPIVPGPVYLWTGAVWQGNTALLSATLDQLLGWKTGDIANDIKIEEGWKRVQAEYQRRGHLDATIDPQAHFDESARQVSYRVAITEGPEYRMADVIVTGLSLDAEKRLRRAWPLAPGQIFDNDSFEKTLATLSHPSTDVFGDLPVHYAEVGHWLRPDSERHTVDVLLDFK